MCPMQVGVWCFRLCQTAVRTRVRVILIAMFVIASSISRMLLQPGAPYSNRQAISRQTLFCNVLRGDSAVVRRNVAYSDGVSSFAALQPAAALFFAARVYSGKPGCVHSHLKVICLRSTSSAGPLSRILVTF